MIKSIGFLFIAVVIWTAGRCFAQFSTNDFSISFLTTRDGLSQASNRFMLQDKKGYMWISSQDGINRYNGLSFFHFDDLRYYEGCQPFNEVFGLVEDNYGDIWISSAHGLYRYSQMAEKFTRVDLSREKNKGKFLKPFAMVGNEIWVSDGGAFFHAVKTDTKKSRVLFRVPDSLALSQGFYINPQVDKKGNFWTASRNKLIFIDVHTATIQQFTLFTDNNNSANAEIKSIALETGSEVLGISTIRGLVLFDIGKQKRIPVNDPENQVTGNETHYIRAEKNGFLLAATGHPLMLVDARGATVTTMLDNQTTGRLLPASYETVCLYRDKWERIWYNMDGEFIAIIDFTKPFFKKLTKDMRGGLPHGTVGSICSIGDTVLICDGQMTVLNKKTGLIERKFIPPAFPNAPSQVNLICYDSADRRLWLAAREKIYYYDLRTNKLTAAKFSFPGKIAYSNPVRGFYKIRNGPLLIATTIGLYSWDEEKNKSRQLELNGESGIVQMDQLSGNRIAVSTFNNNVHLYKIHANGLQTIRSLHFEHFVCGLTEDVGRGILWVATAQGVYKINNGSYTVLRRYTKADGMVKDFVYSVRCDRSGWVWCSTNRGIVAINPADDRIINFDENANLQDLEFNRGAVATDKEGYIYFGGVKGVNYFKPPFFYNDTNSPELVIEEVNLNNQPFHKGLPDAISEIRYNYGPSLLSLKAVALHLKSAPAYKIIYRLNKDPNRWVEIENGTSIQFFDLAPGRYILDIGFKDVFSDIKRAHKKLLIIVLPPWYQTWWFYSSCVIVIAFLIYFYFRLRLQHKLRVFHVRNLLHRDLHDDVGATLSSIKAYSEILGRNGNDRVIQKLINENAAEMIDRLEVISWATNPLHDNLKSLTDAMLRFARPATHAQGVDLQFESFIADEAMPIPAHVRQHVLLIFKEAIHNMLKYAGATRCEVMLRLKNQQFIVCIKDNGKGHDGLVKGGGSGLRNIQKRTEEMQGSLEIESAPKQGFSICIRIPYPFKIPKIRYGKEQHR